MLSYSGKNGDTYVDADYLWKCSKLEKIITMDSTVWDLGCATFNNSCYNTKINDVEALVAEIETKLDEIEKIIPVATPVAVSEPVSVVPEVVVEKPAEPTVVQPPVERVEPKFVPEPSVVTSAEVPLHNVVVEQSEKPKPDATKRRGRRTTIEASVVNPVVAEVPKV
jgi:hypothetical protein